jgi:hypothetical protein
MILLILLIPLPPTLAGGVTRITPSHDGSCKKGTVAEICHFCLDTYTFSHNGHDWPTAPPAAGSPQG